MINFKLDFLPNQFMVGIGWHHNDEFTSMSHYWIFIMCLGPCTLMWSKPKPYLEFLGPFNDGPLSDIRKSTD